MSLPKVVIMCPGLGHIGRGYESFARELFDELRTKDVFDLSLLKGGGEEAPREHVLPCLRRTGRSASLLSELASIESYKVEQFTFFLSSIPFLLRSKPQLLLFSDFILGTYLWHLRRRLGLRYKLLFSNGAPNGPPFTRCDHVQQVLPCHLETAIRGGTPAEMQSLIPYAIKLDGDLSTTVDKDAAKRALSIPSHRKVVLSVGAISDSHKRMKYLIDEFAALEARDRFFLVILGQHTPETPEIEAYAKARLNDDDYMLKSVSAKEVAKYYEAADVFVLSSLSEGLPRVTIEAMSHGLPIVVHDYQVTRETLETNASYVDMRIGGNLSAQLTKVVEAPFDRIRQKQICYEHYSWDALLPRYTAMINKVLAE